MLCMLQEKCREITCSQLTELYNKSCHWIAKSAVGLCFEIFIQVSINGSSLEKHDDRQILNYFQGVTEQCNGEIVFEMYSEVLSQVNMTVLVFHAVFTKDVEYIDTLLKLDGEKINGTDSVVQVLGEERPDTTRSRNNLSIRKYFARLDPPIFLDPCTEMFTVSKFLHCPTIQLDISDFDIVNTTEMVLKSSDRKISSKDFIRNNETHISMCLQDFLTLSKKNAPSNNTTLNANVLSIIALVCIACSMLALAITIAVYIAFPSLRTQPGINNLFLSVCLFLALGFLSFGVLPIQGALCTIVGLLVHFLWLNSMFWMNICSYHMFKIFGNMQATMHKNLTQKYLPYCLILSFVSVISNIVWSELISSGQNIGYGRRQYLCYILHAEMITYTMTAPVGLVLFSNLLMYTVVICRIYRTPAVKRSTLKTRMNFSIYIKLSTITGIAWFTYIPVMLTKSFVLEAIFNILVGLQGVFIMMAFVCNRRVIILLKETFQRVRAKNDLSSTSSQKTIKTDIQKSSKTDEGFHEEIHM